MYCSKCGNELRDDDVFCPKCGNKIEQVESDSNKRKLLKRILLGTGMTTVLVIVIFVIFKLSSNNTTELNDYSNTTKEVLTESEEDKDVPEDESLSWTDDMVIVFGDANVEKSVRKQFDIPEGDITYGMIKDKKTLIIPVQEEQMYLETRKDELMPVNLDSLKYFTGVENLELCLKKTNDIGVVTKLPSLKSISLSGFTSDDLEIIKNCKLETLILRGYQGGGFGSLKDMKCLKEFDYYENPKIITSREELDLSALAEIQGLEKLRISSDRVNLDFLRQLHNLTEFKYDAYDRDIRPLKMLIDISKMEVFWLTWDINENDSYSFLWNDGSGELGHTHASGLMITYEKIDEGLDVRKFLDSIESYPPYNSDNAIYGLSSDEILDAFVRGDIDAEGMYEGQDKFNISDLLNNDEEWLKYTVGERLDLDNDGENELIMDGPYGGMFLDARDGKVVILAQGEGTAGVLNYAQFDNAFWVAHCDTSHGGRECYFFDKYNGKGEITDSTKLSAEYWDSPDDKYDENSDFEFQGKKITMEEFEGLRGELFYHGVDY